MTMIIYILLGNGRIRDKINKSKTNLIVFSMFSVLIFVVSYQRLGKPWYINNYCKSLNCYYIPKLSIIKIIPNKNNISKNWEQNFTSQKRLPMQNTEKRYSAMFLARIFLFAFCLWFYSRQEYSSSTCFCSCPIQACTSEYSFQYLSVEL